MQCSLSTDSRSCMVCGSPSTCSSSADATLLDDICNSVNGKKGDNAEIVRQLCKDIAAAYAKYNVAVILRELVWQLHVGEMHACAEVEIIDDEKGPLVYKCCVFRDGILNSIRLKECCCVQSAHIKHGSQLIFRTPAGAADRKFLDKVAMDMEMTTK